MDDTYCITLNPLYKNYLQWEDINLLLKHIVEMKNIVETLALNNDDKSDIDASLDDIQKQIESSKPDWASIERLKRGLGRILQGLEQSQPVITLASLLAQIAPMLGG